MVGWVAGEGKGAERRPESRGTASPNPTHYQSGLPLSSDARRNLVRSLTQKIEEEGTQARKRRSDAKAKADDEHEAVFDDEPQLPGKQGA